MHGAAGDRCRRREVCRGIFLHVMHNCGTHNGILLYGCYLLFVPMDGSGYKDIFSSVMGSNYVCWGSNHLNWIAVLCSVVGCWMFSCGS
jgi:hypothetical protein